MKRKICDIRKGVELWRDEKTGVAWVKNCNDGLEYSPHPNIDRTGSVRGMKNLGYWGKKDKVARTNGWIFNVSRVHVSGELDNIALEACRCPGCIERRERAGQVW